LYVTVYWVVELGLTEIEAPFKFPGFQVKVPPGTEAVAESVAVWPEQIVVPEVVITGKGLIVTVTGVNAEGQPPLMFQEIVPEPFPFCTPCVVVPPTTPPM
jgi:hypothetical protein